MKLVLIEWLDSAQPIPEWQFLAGIEPGEAVRCVSVGWLIQDGVDVKTLAPNLAGLGTDRQVSGVIRIPARCVDRLVELDLPVGP